MVVVNFTQNLSSVLLDQKRLRSEQLTFFTRHWGDSFVHKNRVPSSPLLRTVPPDYFNKYLETTAKKHRQCLRAKRELRRTLARHQQDTRTDADDVPTILLDPHFSLADSRTFEAIFLEPVCGEPDRLNVDGKPYTTFLERQRRDSGTSLTLSISEDAKSLQPHESYEAGGGRYFRPYDVLQNCLEFYHDLVDARLNNQLAAKSNSFWKAVISCGSLSGELADAKEKVALVRWNLKKVDVKLYHRMVKVISLYKARQQQTKILQKLQDMTCLRDAQLTVQMLLNQSDYPKALECIETAQDVLNNELRGVVCFRHLGSQLQELHKVIAKMLYEEFVTLIQRELGRQCENENEAAYQEGQLNPIVIGLLRVREYRFVQVLQQEIVEALKNTLRQIMKAHVLKSISDDELSEFDPSLGNLCTQMRRLDFNQWFNALKHVLHVLYLMCRRVQSIQEVIIDNIEHFSNTVARRPSQTEQNVDELCSSTFVSESNGKLLARYIFYSWS
ncbi:unnamed protein product [Gongylonema pulchrum]|uniref:Vps54_N domain-containing protein n=1 Tax=Gongylonema pulchrum TaxID=637853 RepID=A0A183DYF3_9BILA|nr:unnamed protein product [Gongylonema pulchrum]